MRHRLHPWELDPDEAIFLQSQLRERLVLTWDDRPVTSIGGADVGFIGDHACAAIVVFRYPDMTPLSAVTAVGSLAFPYTPGLLAFREGPIILSAWERLPFKPDLLMFDGQGIAHPRGLGMASQMGLWLEMPTIGVAKSRLYGCHVEVGPLLGDQSDLKDEHNPAHIIGAVVRTREKSKPLYISPGHLMDLENAVTFVRACCHGYRLPEPTRWAHKISIGGDLPLECRTQ